ncbi:MAG: butyrate kinase [Bacteroidales bacterium]|nr:butyrate kinase [Bacteroidales bacterium]
MKILVINPGSTSTKIAVYKNREFVFESTIIHTVEQLSEFKQTIDQLEYRKQIICDELKKNVIPLSFNAIIARGGLIKPIPGGVYYINDKMKLDVLTPMRHHASNLGCLIASEIAEKQEIPCPAFIADPGVVDERQDLAKVTGLPLLPKIAISHVLNQRAIGRQYAREQQKEYDSLNLIIIHLGGGISIGVHQQGKIIDVNNALDGDGPFSPERAGTLPSGALIDLCFSGKYTQEELKKKIAGQAGLVAYLNTTDLRIILKRIETGDKKAQFIVEAMVYNIAKYIGAVATVLKGEIDAILLTGGMANSEYVINLLTDRISFLAPIAVYPGEKEMEALALNALAVLNGRFKAKEYK